MSNIVPTMLAVYEGTGYKIALFLHVLAVVIAFGPTFAYAFFSTVSRKYPAATPALIEGIQRTDRYLVTPGMIVLLLAGMYLLADADKVWEEADVFVSVGFAAILILFILQFAFFIPQSRKAREIAERDLEKGDELSEDYMAIAQKIGKVGSLAGLIVIVSIFFMTYKPFL